MKPLLVLAPPGVPGHVPWELHARRGAAEEPTWVEGLHVAVQQADVQLAEVDGVIKARDDHPPHPSQDTHQDVDGEE